MVVAPSLLACDFLNVEKELMRLEEAKADWLHLDVMDGMFVPNITFGFDLIAAMRKKSNLFFDVHLMITEPINYIEHFVKAGSDLITFHVEANSNPLEVINLIKKNDIKAGISINPGTSTEDILPLLKDIDLVLVMSVEPGFGGQSFKPETGEKIKQLIEYRNIHNLDFLIQVDGGINDKTINNVLDVDVVVAGSYVFCDDMADRIKILKG